MYAEKIIERIRKIQNGTQNLGWGVTEYSPKMDLKALERTESQWVIVVGHNVHRKIRTLFLEVFIDGTYSLSVVDGTAKGRYLCDKLNDEGLISCLIHCLKDWYPEVRGNVIG